ncbi:hypothetical protein NQ318_009137 [Aromia moschata]|uniref:Uncharacterized protein n=1 Tax=Aromia moschata TaxID=1265417 RepID=A0AAV8XAF9_9CUCU|nr:hypothetical protein NQ318_009137 [Aromia moschata]
MSFNLLPEDANLVGETRVEKSVTLLGNPKDKIDNNEKCEIYEIRCKDCDQKQNNLGKNMEKYHKYKPISLLFTRTIYEVWLLNNRTETATSALRACCDKFEQNCLVILSPPSLDKPRDVKRPKTIHAPTAHNRELAEITGIDKECVRQILQESFNIRKVCAKIVPKLLTPKQKESRMNICADILNNTDTDPGLLDTVITCDK